MRPALAILTLVAVALTALLLSCGDTEEEIAPAITPTPAGTGPTPTIAAPTPSPMLTPVPVPSGWKRYSDPTLGFSLSYPPDLVFKDLTGPSPIGGLRERDLEFRSEEDPGRAFGVSIIEAYPANVDLKQWAVEFAGCRESDITGAVLDGIPAISCHRDVLGPPTPATIAEHADRIYLISASFTFSDEEFTKVLQTFQF